MTEKLFTRTLNHNQNKTKELSVSLHYAGSYHKMVIDILKTLAYYFLSVISCGNHLKPLMSSLFADIGHGQLFVKMQAPHAPLSYHDS